MIDIFLLVHIFPSQTNYILPIIIAIVIDPENYYCNYAISAILEY